MQQCFADNMVDRKLYVIVIVTDRTGKLKSTEIKKIVHVCFILVITDNVVSNLA